MEERRLLELEKVRQNADQLRSEYLRFSNFFRGAWHVLEPSTRLQWNWHLQALCDHLEAISRGTLHPRLIANVPPGCSKSSVISVAWQAYEWGPLGMRGTRFLSTSYEQSNVTRDTRKARDLIMSEWYQALWSVELKRTAETSFENVDRGTREGVPFASLTAKRGDRLIIDDPHSLDGAESDVEREKAVRRFLEGGQNRLNDQEKSAIVIVMQRLHEGDLTGALLARELGYIHLCLPMEFEIERRCVTPIFTDPRTYDGELLDPQRFPPRAVELLRRDNDYMWAGQYQQRPAPREGGMFKLDRIQKVANVPAGAQYVRGWDIAGSTKRRSPFTAGGLLAYKDGILYIVDMQRARKEIDQAEALIVDTAQADLVRLGNRIIQSLPQDPGSAGKSQKHHLSNRLVGTNFHFSPETGTKEDRAIPLASLVNAGQVRMVAGDWNGALENEMRNFPGSLYKDQIDALSRAFMEMIPFMRQDDDMVYAPIYGHKLG